MGKWVRDITPRDFLEWANKHKEEFEDFWHQSEMLELVEEAESEDFFGTEGFDKRFG
jgi:hypothetical protein